MGKGLDGGIWSDFEEARGASEPGWETAASLGDGEAMLKEEELK